MTAHEILSFPIPRQDTFSPPSELARLRQKCPISKVKLFDNSESWLLTKRDDCCAALDSQDLSADRRNSAYPEIHEGGAKAKEKRPTFVNLDDPAHKEQRALLSSWFTDDSIAKLRPMMEDVVNSNLDNLLRKHGKHTLKPVDLIESFAGLVPPQIIYHLLGIPEKDIPALSKDSEVRTSTSRNAAETSNTNLRKYMADFVQQRVQDPKQDLVSTLVTGPLKEGKLQQEDIVELAFLVLVAGNAALINSIALGVVTLLQHPDQLEQLKHDPKLAPQVVSELLRYNTTSALNSRRVVKKATKIGGQEMKVNDKVICAVQSADRDESHFKNAANFDIKRQLSSEDILGFGWGPHRCIGEELTRVELEIVFNNIWKKLPDLRLAGGLGEVEWTPLEQNIGVTRLLVIW